MSFNILQKSLLVLFFSVNSLFSSSAQVVPGTLEMAVYPAKAPLKLWFVLVKLATTNAARIELVNQDNQALYMSTLSKKEQRVNQLFDLNEVADGTYTIRVTTGTETVEKTFTVQTPIVQEQVTKRSLTFTKETKVAVNNL
ncbi:T9SS type A sorting domain-containing protein [Spirosoma litoris]